MENCGDLPECRGLRPFDAEEFRENAHKVVDFIADYYRDIEKFPVRSQVQPGYLQTLLPDNAPEYPETLESVLTDIQNKIIPGITHWQSPNFFAFYPSNSSTAGLLGEMLSGGFSVIGFSWISSPAATELEAIVLDWLGKIINLPEAFLLSGKGGGVIQGTASEAILVALLAARDKALKAMHVGSLEKLVVYGSDQTHSSLEKACMVGTTSSTAVDPLMELGKISQDHGMWLHVDAAYAGSACICPEYRHCLDGVELADSFNMNAHKWLLTNFDCSALWVKDSNALVEALSTNPEYLRNKASESNTVVDYKDWQIPLGRRFRSLKLWMVLRLYGVTNLRTYIRNHIDLAKHFEELVRGDAKFEIMAPRIFALVCFRLLPPSDDPDNDNGYTLNSRLLEAVNNSGHIYLSHTVLSNTFTLRFVVGAPLTEQQHVSAAWKILQHQAVILLKSYEFSK